MLFFNLSQMPVKKDLYVWHNSIRAIAVENKKKELIKPLPHQCPRHNFILGSFFCTPF